MILFFLSKYNLLYVVGTANPLQKTDIQKLNWLFGDAELLSDSTLKGFFIGPRKEMVTPWSTNAVEITQNMAIIGIQRIEEFKKAANKDAKHDRMLEVLYTELTQDIF